MDIATIIGFLLAFGGIGFDIGADPTDSGNADINFAPWTSGNLELFELSRTHLEQLQFHSRSKYSQGKLQTALTAFSPPRRR